MTATVVAGTGGSWNAASCPTSAGATLPMSAARCDRTSRPPRPQIANWKIDTAPTPTTLPSISSNGRSDETRTSTIRVVFSSSTELITFTPYTAITMNNTIDMTYASQNDCSELSPVVLDPEIFFVSSLIGRCARLTVPGSTPARSSRAFNASAANTARSSSMSRNDETFDA